MSYIDGFLIPVKIADKAAFIAHAKTVDALFLEWGATRVVEGWGDDVPDGTTTDFNRAVLAGADETVAFSWIEWPDKATRDAAFEKMRTDPRMMAGGPPPFDGKRMVMGGFEPVVDVERDAR